MEIYLPNFLKLVLENKKRLAHKKPSRESNIFSKSWPFPFPIQVFDLTEKLNKLSKD